MATPAPLKPVPMAPLTGGSNEDRFVPAWFPADKASGDDARDKAHARLYEYCQYQQIIDPRQRESFLKRLEVRFAPMVVYDDEDIDSPDSSDVESNINDSPPRPRALKKRAPTGPKKKNDNAKRARTIKRRQNKQYSQIFSVLDPLRHELEISDKQFCALLKRYRVELAQTRVQEAEDYNESLK